MSAVAVVPAAVRVGTGWQAVLCIPFVCVTWRGPVFALEHEAHATAVAQANHPATA